MQNQKKTESEDATKRSTTRQGKIYSPEPQIIRRESKKIKSKFASQENSQFSSQHNSQFSSQKDSHQNEDEKDEFDQIEESKEEIIANIPEVVQCCSNLSKTKLIEADPKFFEKEIPEDFFNFSANFPTYAWYGQYPQGLINYILQDENVVSYQIPFLKYIARQVDDINLITRPGKSFWQLLSYAYFTNSDKLEYKLLKEKIKEKINQKEIEQDEFDLLQKCGNYIVLRFPFIYLDPQETKAMQELEFKRHLIKYLASIKEDYNVNIENLCNQIIQKDYDAYNAIADIIRLFNDKNIMVFIDDYDKMCQQALVKYHTSLVANAN